MQFQQSSGLNLLSHDQFEEIHLATLEVLDRTGVVVHEKEALDLLKKGGARIDGNRVRIPAWMVQEALGTAPCRIPIGNRNGERVMFLEKGRSYYGTGSDTPFTIDVYTGLRRQAVKQDVINAARICDGLANIDFVMSMGMASDTPIQTAYVHQFEAMALNTVKPIVYTADNLQDLKDIVTMAEIIAGGPEALVAAPFLILYDEPSSPLQHIRAVIEKLLYLAEKRLPLLYAPAVMTGGTGPVTQAGDPGRGPGSGQLRNPVGPCHPPAQGQGSAVYHRCRYPAHGHDHVHVLLWRPRGSEKLCINGHHGPIL